MLDSNVVKQTSVNDFIVVHRGDSLGGDEVDSLLDGGRVDYGMDCTVNRQCNFQDWKGVGNECGGDGGGHIMAR